MIAVVALGLGLVGCSGSATGTGVPGSSGSSDSPRGSSEGDALFGAPTASATPDTIFGLWGGTQRGSGGVTFDTRFRFTSAAITAAAHCFLADGSASAIVAVTAAGRVSNESIAILESKEDENDNGKVKCRVTLAPRELKRCARLDGFQKQCFAIDGTSLVMYDDSSFAKVELTKVSD